MAEIVVDHLGFDTPDLSKVARLLKLHPRTLQRILSAEGTSFNNIVDEVRQNQTLKLITTTQLSFSQIATRVGMREQSSLARAVRRWFNTSPSRLRDETQVRRKVINEVTMGCVKPAKLNDDPHLAR